MKTTPDSNNKSEGSSARVCARISKKRWTLSIALMMMGLACAGSVLRIGAANQRDAAVAVAARPVVTGPACPVNDCFTLAAPGDDEFWDGEYIDSAQVPAPEQCDVTAPCYKYQLTVGEGGSRLRVGFDAVLKDFRSFPDPPGPPPGFRFRIQVRDEEDNLITESCLYDDECGGNSTNAGYSTEVFVPSPAAGVWTVLVIPTHVTDLAFRMRAKLEPPPVTGPVRVLLPNLRLMPPFEPTFIAPAYPFGPAGQAGVSCMPEEIAEEDATHQGTTRCLRFSAGVHNNGEGWLGIHFFTDPIQFCPDPRPGEVPGEVFQRLYKSDHTFLDCDSPNLPESPCQGRQSAGCAALHPSHAHFHYEGIFRYTLLKVTDLSTGTLETPPGGGEGHKRGLQPLDEEMADWDRFYQDPRNATSGSGMTFSMSAGWGDVYEWNRSGQYVDFPIASGDGFYVIRGEADADDNVVESEEDDNTGYALVFVQGETVDLCERGYGTDPWDPNKVVQSPSSAIASDALATQLSGPCALAIGRSAVSRKTHGTAGNFDINLPLTGSTGIECRTGGANGNHQIVITFANAVTLNDNQNPQATLTAPNGGSVDTVVVNSAVVTVNLKNVGNQQTITLTLNNVDDGTTTADVVIPMRVLAGDTTADGSVNSSDISETKSRSGQTATATNFRSDVTVNGVINSSDIGLVKSKSGTGLP